MRAMKLDVSERMSVAFIWNTSQTDDGYLKALPFKPVDNTSLISATTPNSLTGANAQSMIDLAQTWNTSGAPTAVKVNITDTASDAASKLFDFQVGGVSKGSLTKAGLFTAVSGAFGAASFSGTLTASGAIAGTTGTFSGAVTFNGPVTFNSSVAGGIVTSSMTLTGDLIVGGLIFAGSGVVSLTDAGGKIRGLSALYFASLDGAALFSLNASNLASGTVPVTRLGSGVPSANTFLRGDSVWATPLSNAWTVVAKAATYTVLTADVTAQTLFVCTGTFTLTLPTASTQGTTPRQIAVENHGTGVITVAPATGTIVGAASYELPIQYMSIVLVPDAVTNNWVII